MKSDRPARFRGQRLFPGALLLLAITLIAYIPIFRAGFVWDDDSYVEQNATLRTLDGLYEIWTNWHATPQYYPLVHTSFWVEYHLWGATSALGYHIDNVLLHALSAILIWRLLNRLNVPGALLAAAIFAVHPVHVESVGWITERKNVLSLVFYLLALRSYLRSTGSEPVLRDYAFSLLFFLLALLSKTVTATLPAAILLIFWWKRGRIRVRAVTPLLPFFVLAAVCGSITGYLERTQVGARGPEWAALTPLHRVLIASRAVWFYAGKLLVPWRLTFIYPRWSIDPRDPLQWLYLVALIAVIAGLWLRRRRLGRGPLVAVLFFIGTLTPALGFVNVYPMRYSFVADHFQYHASIGLIALAAACIARFKPAGLIIVALLIALTFHRCL
ncbi:MAG TPA: hypothetical protein VLI90_04585, partial [Tepidisphaeraceae bacterium]|nr:hypothetical protein [Tepidisphaeraceae bacterium]